MKAIRTDKHTVIKIPDSTGDKEVQKAREQWLDGKGTCRGVNVKILKI